VLYVYSFEIVDARIFVIEFVKYIQFTFCAT